MANEIFGRPSGIFSAGLFAVSPLVVELTRRAWNPNTLPFYILVAFYFVWRYFKKGKTRDFLLAFGFYGYCLSLHFGAWTLIPLFVLIWIYGAKRRLSRLGLLGGLGLLFFFVCPLLIFELRHNFFLTSQAKIFFFDGGHLGVKSGTNIIESFLVSLISLFAILTSGRIFVGYQAPFELTGRLNDLFNLATPVSVVAQKPFSISFQWWGIAILLLVIYFSFKFFKEDKLSLSLIWTWILWGILASKMYSGNFFFFYYLFLFPFPILFFGFLFKKLIETKKIKIFALFVFGGILFFHLKTTTIFRKDWRNLDDLTKVANIIGNNISAEDKFNIATIQRDKDRWDRNSVDYRYFVESTKKKRALDWYPQDYERADYLFIVDETGEADVLKSKIMEIETFKPKEIIDFWEAGKGIIVYKIAKNDHWD